MIVSLNLELLNEVKKLIKEIYDLLEENKEAKRLERKEAATLVLWRNFWQEKLDRLRVAY